MGEKNRPGSVPEDFGMEDTYLGDGVYASYRYNQVRLDLRAQDSTTCIALEPEVLQALVRYANQALNYNIKP